MTIGSYEEYCNDYALYGDPMRDHYDHEENARYDRYDGWGDPDPCAAYDDQDAWEDAQEWAALSDAERAERQAAIDALDAIDDRNDHDDEVPF